MRTQGAVCRRAVLLLLMLGMALSSAGTAHAQTETTLYDFTGGANGGAPEAGLVFDGKGNLYGTASGGGESGGCLFGLGCGTVFELSPAIGGGWTLTTIYTFRGGDDGADPDSTLLMDGAGNLFGETLGGGGSSSGCLRSDAAQFSSFLQTVVEGGRRKLCMNS